MPLTTATCPNCRRETWDVDLFCGHCGADLRLVSPGAAPAAARAGHAQHTGRAPAAASSGSVIRPPYRPSHQGWIAVTALVWIGGFIGSSVGDDPEIAFAALFLAGPVLWTLLILLRPVRWYAVFAYVLTTGVLLLASTLADRIEHEPMPFAVAGGGAVLLTIFAAIRNCFGKGKDF